MSPLLRVTTPGADSEVWSLVARRGAIAGAASMQDWELAGVDRAGTFPIRLRAGQGDVAMELLLDTLGDHGQVQAVGHGDDRRDDEFVLLVDDGIAEEGAVDLQGTDRQALEVGQ